MQWYTLELSDATVVMPRICPNCLAEASVPFVLHVGGGKLLPKAFHNNGRPLPKDWLGGGENLRAKDFPVLHHSPERFLACITLDGVFERHPGLRLTIAHLGGRGGLTPLRDHAVMAHMPALLALAKYQDVAVAATGVPGYSTEAYPFPTMQTLLGLYENGFIEAFGTIEGE